MNSSSIVMAFILAGVLSIVIHQAAIGPVVLGPSQMVNQASTSSSHALH